MDDENGESALETDARALSQHDKDVILAELSNVLSSAAFRNSKRSKDFLRYVVEKTLTGEGDALKERTIGIEVFGKELAYNANEDPVVRVSAGEIRKRLGVYYSTHPHQSGVVIELPAGSYVPKFQRLTEFSEHGGTPGNPAEAAIQPTDIFPQTGTARSARPQKTASSGKTAKGRSRRWWAFAAVALFLLGFAAAGRYSLHRTPSAFDQFWQPVLSSPSPVVVSAAYTPVYLLQSDSSVPHFGTYIQVNNGYLGGGDLIAASEISGMLGAKRHPFQIGIGHSVTFPDLSAAPSILIGYSIQFWSPLTKGFRYSFNLHGMILDNGAPTPWVPHGLTPELHTDDDYAIVTRVFHPQTHEMMILVCGSEQYGTQAAAELISNPDLLANALRNAPRGWQTKNLQLILHAQVIDNSPTVPQVIATYYW